MPKIGSKPKPATLRTGGGKGSAPLAAKGKSKATTSTPATKPGWKPSTPVRTGGGKGTSGGPGLAKGGKTKETVSPRTPSPAPAVRSGGTKGGGGSVRSGGSK